MIFSLQNSVKLEVLNKSLPFVEKALYEILIAAGFDPDEFDPDSFVAESNNMDHNTITVLLSKYNNIIQKINDLEG